MTSRSSILVRPSQADAKKVAPKENKPEGNAKDNESQEKQPQEKQPQENQPKGKEPKEQESKPNESKEKNTKDKQEDENNESEIILPAPPDGEMPTYFHVGGWAKDCLMRGYKFGVWHLECSTTTNRDLTLISFADANPDFKSIHGGFEARQRYGNFHVAQDWLSNNEWLSELGVHADAGNGKLYAIVKAAYAQWDNLNLKAKLKTGIEYAPCKLELIVPLIKEPHLMGYFLVAPSTNWLFGYRAVYNMDETGFDKHAFCVGYNNGATEVGLKLENFQDLRGSIFQRIGESWAVALKINLYNQDDTRKFAIGGQYKFGNGSLLKAKVREDANVGFVYQAKMSENIEVMYHLGCDAKSPLNGDHKIGVSWNLNV